MPIRSQLVKKLLTSWWTGEQAPPPGAAPQIFNLSRGSFARRAKPQNPADSAPPATPTTICLSFPLENSGRKLCKEAIFALGNGISRRKNQHPRPTRRSPGSILMREGCGPLALSRGSVSEPTKAPPAAGDPGREALIGRIFCLKELVQSFFLWD